MPHMNSEVSKSTAHCPKWVATLSKLGSNSQTGNYPATLNQTQDPMLQMAHLLCLLALRQQLLSLGW